MTFTPKLKIEKLDKCTRCSKPISKKYPFSACTSCLEELESQLKKDAKK